MSATESPAAPPAGGVDSAAAWARLAVALALSTLGGVGMWSVVVMLPAVQSEFGVLRSVASLPYTANMLGFALGGVLMGRVVDRFGIVPPVIGGAVALAAGYVAVSFTRDIWQFTLAQGLLIGFLGASATFAPMIADISRWFERRRGLAVAICASGNYLAGAIWPPVITWLMSEIGWRHTSLVIGAVCLVAMIPLALLLRRPAPEARSGSGQGAAPGTMKRPDVALAPGVLQALILVAGLACCVAMSMPQVHIVAYCGDLGYGVARGAEMLSLMLALGVVSRLVSGWISDRIGGVRTLLLGSVLQGLTLALYIPFDGLASLYVVSALFGLAQGGIVPSYAVIVREYFPAREAATRVGVAIMATIVGMALGGWLSGVIFDLTGSYRAAFVNGLAWNALNIGICLVLITGGRRRGVRPGTARPA
ncbi:MAG: MFS transporter [Hyphomicrobiaceae bacterium]